jgi:hypothetical protein
MHHVSESDRVSSGGWLLRDGISEFLRGTEQKGAETIRASFDLF